MSLGLEREWGAAGEQAAHVKERLGKGMDMDSQLRQLERRFGPIFKLGRISPILLFETHLKVGCEKQHGFDHITLMIVANSQLDETGLTEMSGRLVFSWDGTRISHWILTIMVIFFLSVLISLTRPSYI